MRKIITEVVEVDGVKEVDTITRNRMEDRLIAELFEVDTRWV